MSLLRSSPMLSVIAAALFSILCVRMQPQKLLDVSELT